MRSRNQPSRATGAAAVLLPLICLPAGAQVVAEESSKQLEPVVVTADPLDRKELDLLRPATVLRGDALRAAESSNLGDTLARLPGVQSSAYGPGAGRPIIRGMESSRVRITESGLGVGDVSGVSPDHRVAADTLNARQVEVLRGPATLLHGSGAMGGLVNIVSERIPLRRIDGTTAALALRGASAERERAAALDMETPVGDLVMRAEGFVQRTDDYRLAAPLIDANGALIASDRLPNSATDTRSIAVGGAWFGAGARIGAAVQRYASDYGIPNPEEPVNLRLRRTRYEMHADAGQAVGPFSDLRAKFGLTDYEHQEIGPDGSVGARFSNRGAEGRLELPYRLADWRGVVGAQLQRATLTGSGEGELPRTESTANALFAVQERAFGPVRVEVGGRIEAERFDVRADYADGTRAPSRSFTLATASAGAAWRLAQAWEVGLTITAAQRAPAAEELYFVGAHPATFAYERGDAGLRKERSLNTDLSLRYATGAWRAQASLFANRVRDYIYGYFDGTTTDLLDEDGNVEETLSNLQFTQADARLHGGEVELAWQPRQGLQVRLWGDTVRARLDSGPDVGGSLPRMAPSRLGLDLGWRHVQWAAQVAVTKVLRQNRVSAFDLRDGEPEQPTAGYTRVDALVAWRPADWPLTLTLQGRNLTNEDMRIHTSFLKTFAPPAGRSVLLGLRAAL
jgi:iron complex outermembrane receptor protein